MDHQELPPSATRRPFTLGGLLQVCGWLVALTSLAGFLGRFSAIFDLCSHFRVQYLVSSLILAILFGLRRQKTETGVFAGMALINLLVLQPYLFTQKVAEGPIGTPKLTVLWWNLAASNSQQSTAVDWILQQDADIIALAEVTPDWEQALAPLQSSHPYALTEARSDNFGMALYSRHPLFNAQTLPFGLFAIPTIEAEVMIGPRAIRVIATHPLPPMTGESTRQRNDQLLWLGQQIRKRASHTLLVGDLNTTPWNHAFREFTAVSGLRRQPSGLYPTWPSTIPFLKIPIDHALVSQDLTVSLLRLGPSIGSDHSPLVADVNW